LFRNLAPTFPFAKLSINDSVDIVVKKNGWLHILLDTIAGSTKNISHNVVYGRFKSFRSNGKKEWMLFSLVYIPPVHDE